MITQMGMQNFKSWLDTKNMRFAPMTGLFGSNSSGKTSILQLFLLLKQTAESPDRSHVLHTGDERSLVDLGTFQDLLFRHDLDLVSSFRSIGDISRPEANRVWATNSSSGIQIRFLCPELMPKGGN